MRISFALIYLLSQYECLDVCPYIYENNTYSGLDICQWIPSKIESIWKYMEFLIQDRKGHQWDFQINWQTKTIEKIGQDIQDSLNTPNWKVITMFYIYDKTQMKSYECEVQFLYPFIQEYETACWSVSSRIIIFKDVFNNNTIFVRPGPIGTEESLRHMMAFDRTDPNSFLLFRIENNTFRILSNDSESQNGTIPSFVPQIRHLWAKLDSVVPYYNPIDNGTGYILLFNIDDRPRYCFTPESGPIADECKTPEKMTKLLSECFEDHPAISQSNSAMRPAIVSKDIKPSIITLIVIILLILF